MRKKYVIYILALCLVAGLLFVWLSFGQNGLFDLLNLQVQREENVTALREDPKYFESAARKELGLVRENEIIYRVKEGERGTITRPIQGK
jgi:cell division protein FtsB